VNIILNEKKQEADIGVSSYALKQKSVRIRIGDFYKNQGVYSIVALLEESSSKTECFWTIESSSDKGCANIEAG